MEQFSSTPQEKPKRKQGRPAANQAQIDRLEEKVQELQQQVLELTRRLVAQNEAPTVAVETGDIEQRVDTLYEAFGKFAHYAGGNIPTICRQFGIKVYEPTRADMTKRVG